MNSTTITALIALAFAALAVFSGYRWGHHDAELAAYKTQHDSVVHAIEQANAMAEQDAEILRASAAKRMAQHQIDQRWKQEAARHVATHRDLYGQLLDACGLCLKHAAASGTDPTTCPCGSNAAAPANSGQR